MSADEESYAFGKAEQQVKEMLEEFNEHAPYGLEHRKMGSLRLTEEKIKSTRVRLSERSIDFSYVDYIRDPKNYSQYRS